MNYSHHSAGTTGFHSDCEICASQAFSRRDMLRRAAGGFGAVALSGLLSQLASQTAVAGAVTSPGINPLAARPPMFPAKAKSVIFLYMTGGVSHVDTFDPKPKLFADARQDDHGRQLAGQARPVQALPEDSPVGISSRAANAASRSAICFRTSATSSTICASSARWSRTTPTTTKPRSACTPARSRSPGPASAPGSAMGWEPRTATCRRSSSSAPSSPYAGTQTWGADFLPGCHQGTHVVPGPDADRQRSAAASPPTSCSDWSWTCWRRANRRHLPSTAGRRRSGSPHPLVRDRLRHAARGARSLRPGAARPTPRSRSMACSAARTPASAGNAWSLAGWSSTASGSSS